MSPNLVPWLQPLNSDKVPLQQFNVVPSEVVEDDVEKLDLDGMFATPPPISEPLRITSGPVKSAVLKKA
jgi:hypothetical protein